jgi:vacuolar-type H+-ATPase subunit C/Vma6
MADIINLRAARKRQAREEEARRAAQNRARHGRTKAEKQRDLAEAEGLGSHVEAHRRERTDAEDK